MPIRETIVITGASTGLGAALAQQYASPSTRLGLIATNQTRLEDVAALCAQHGAETHIACIDVRCTDSLKQWLLAFDQKHPIDILIANAGVTSSISDKNESENWESISRVLDVNLYGVFNTIHPLIDCMRARKKGQLILISSLAAYRGLPLTPSYCASKAGVKAYGEALRTWLIHENIYVSIVLPGFVETNMSAQFTGSKPQLQSSEHAAYLIKKGITKRKAIIAFPFPLNLGAWALGIIPFWLAAFFIKLFKYGAKG